MNQPDHRSEEDVVTDEQRAAQIRAKLAEVCDLLDHMHEWAISYRLYMDEIGRWHSACTFTKQVTL